MNTAHPLTETWRAEAMARLFRNVVTADLNSGGKVHGCLVPIDAVDPENGQINPTRNAYQTVNIRQRSYRAHAAVLALILNRQLDVEGGELALHMCNNRVCRAPLHIKLGTHQDNMDYMVECDRAAKNTKNGHATHPGQTPRGNDHYRSRLKGDQRRIALELLKKYADQRGYAEAIAAYLNVSRDTIYNLKRTKIYLAPDVRKSGINLEIRRWIRGAKRSRKPPRVELERIVREIRQCFHDTPDHARAGMITHLVDKYEYCVPWIRKILKRAVYDEIATDIPVPIFFGIGTRKRKSESSKEMQ